MKTFHISEKTPIFCQVNTLPKEQAGSPIGHSTNMIPHIQVEKKKAETGRGCHYSRVLCKL